MNSIHFIKTHRLAGLAALLALLFLSSACSKDSGDSSGDSSTTTGLKISLGGITEGSSESLEKSALESETVTQKLDSDMTVEYTLAPTAASLARTTTAMATGVKYRVLVYKLSDNSYVGYQDYTAGQESSTTPIPVTAGASYTVVAYSYNTSDAITDDPTSTSLSVSPDKDLLYYSGTVTNASNGTNTVTINFDHKFSRVTLVANATDLGANINACSATVSPGYQASMTLPGGVVTAGSAATQTVSWSTLGAQTVTSNSRTVFTNASSTLSLSLDFTLGSYTSYTGQTLSFTKTLTAGYTYTLTANLKNNFIIGGVRWAKGNLYKSSATTTGIWSTQEYYSSDYTKGDYWNFGATSPYNNRTYYLTGTTVTWGGVGSSSDPCYNALGGKWHVPTVANLQSLVDANSAWGLFTSKYGRFFKTATVPATANKNDYLFLPAAGWYNQTATSLATGSDGNNGFGNYTSNQGFSSTLAYFFDFSSSSEAINGAWYAYRDRGISLRCAQDL